MREKRDLQLEAKAHITVQKWIDAGGLKGRAVTSDGIREIHRRFCELLPEDLLWVEDPETKERVRVVPGELRKRDVKVGTHIAISPGAVPRFLKRFEEVYGRLSKTDSILGAAAAHHRLVWIHPFVDGNGRVARLMSHAMLLETLDTGAVWSVARGLARNVDAYKGHLAACDITRRNDLDGRGNLSEEALAGFTEFFLRICIDQVELHGKPDAAGSPAGAHPSVGRRRNQARRSCRRSRAASSKPCSTGESCRAPMPLALWARATAMRAGSSRR